MPSRELSRLRKVIQSEGQCVMQGMTHFWVTPYSHNTSCHRRNPSHEKCMIFTSWGSTCYQRRQWRKDNVTTGNVWCTVCCFLGCRSPDVWAVHSCTHRCLLHGTQVPFSSGSPVSQYTSGIHGLGFLTDCFHQVSITLGFSLARSLSCITAA